MSREYPTPAVPSLSTSDDGWEIVNDRNENEDTYVSEAVLDNSFFNTNGYLGVRHRTEFSTANLRSVVNVAGTYHCDPLWHAIGSQNLPKSDEVGAMACTVDLNVFIDGEQCSLADMKMRRLSMRDGVYRCECIVTGCDGLFSMRLSYRRFTSLVDLSTWCADVRFDSFLDERDEGSRGTAVSIQLLCEYQIDITRWELAGPLPAAASSDGSRLDFAVESRSSDASLACQSVFVCTVERREGPQRQPTATTLPCSLVLHDEKIENKCMPVSSPSGSDVENSSGAPLQHSSPDYHLSRSGSIRSSKGPTRLGFERGSTVEFRASDDILSITATLVSRHSSKSGEPRQTSSSSSWAVEETEPAPQQLEKLLALQRARFDSFWATFAFDASLQDEIPPQRMRNVLRWNAYILFCSGQGARHGLSVSALSSAGPGMRINMQTYLFHGMFYVFSAPEVAKDLLLHLYGMLPHARLHARNMAIPTGALYPHITISGAENCGGYFLNHSPRFHINGDIAHVITLYLDAAGPDLPAELAVKLLEVLLETARAWVHIGEWQEGNTVFRIDDATGPDEYNGLVENCFYTHLSAKQHLSKAVAVLQQLMAVYTEEVSDLLSSRRLQMDEAEVKAMKDVADAIVLHRDDRRGVYFSHAHFDALTEWPTPETIRYPLYLNYHPLVIYRHKVCSMPAVLLGMLLHQDLFEESDIRRNLEYYEPFCTHDAMESVAVIASAQFRANGDCGGEAAHLVEALAQLDLENVLYAADEGLHLASASAVWFTVAFGIGGLRVVNSTIHLTPVLPVGWECVSFTVQWRGSILLVTIRPEVTEYELKKGDNFRFVHYDHTRIHLQTGFGKCAPRTKVQIDRGVQEQLTTYFDGVIFSVEAIVTNFREISFEAWRTVLDKYFENVEAREGRAIAPFTYAEYINLMVYQEESSQMSYIGLQNVLRARNIDLPAGSKADAEIVESRLGLANAKVEEMCEMISRRPLVLANGILSLLKDLQKLGIRVALVTYTRSMNDVLTKLPQLQKLFTTKIDGIEARLKQMRGRPHADLYVKAAKKMHLTTERCVVFATNMDKGYRTEDLQKFHVFFDVVRAQASYHSDPTTPLSSTTEQNLISILDSGFPSSTAKCEDLILARQRRKDKTSAFAFA
jgi:trehalose/maltose hydrolase-like predicted phosphorylase/beta-phosphoglucomutase-like phosphatase (HAD superfamily)